MNRTIFAAMSMCIFCSSAFATSADDIQQGYADMKRICGSNPNSTECYAAAQKTDTNRDNLLREMQNTRDQRDQERQRIQQEEMWREQVRRRQ